MIDYLSARGGGYILIPPGRYRLGTASARTASPIGADILVKANVTLRFMPGAAIVPMSYARGEQGYRPWLGERYEVTIEVQGHIDAGLQQIFDVFVDRTRSDVARADSTDAPSAPAGRVIFTRANVRQLYPEWWGAETEVPRMDDVDAADKIRRTTRALQATFNAAQKTFLASDARHPERIPGVVSFLVADATGALVSDRVYDGVLIEGDFTDPAHPEGVIYYRSAPDERVRRRFEFQTAESTPTRRIAFSFVSAFSQPSIPIVLSNDYMIDNELWIGVPPDQVQSPSANVSGFVLRGNRGSSTSRSGNVRIIAASRSYFTSKPGGSASKWPYVPAAGAPVTSRGVVYGSASLLSIRGPLGFTIENVTFDANHEAPRCVTVADFVGGQHATGFEGCSFVRARSELVHCGAEVQSVPGPLRTGVALPELVSFVPPSVNYWNGNQDLSCLRFARCRFETVTHPAGAGRQSATGVYFYAGQTLGVEFQACNFSGPGNPMVHLVSGRASFTRCHFKTGVIENAVTRPHLDDDPMTSRANGVDILIDSPPQVTTTATAARQSGTDVACLTARDVMTESTQFLTTYSGRAGYVQGAAHAATVLQNVRHRPTSNTSPSVFWGGDHNCALVIMGCDLPVWNGGNPVRLAQTALAPVFDLGNHVHGGTSLFTFNPGVVAMARVMSR